MEDARCGHPWHIRGIHHPANIAPDILEGNLSRVADRSRKCNDYMIPGIPVPVAWKVDPERPLVRFADAIMTPTNCLAYPSVYLPLSVGYQVDSSALA